MEIEKIFRFRQFPVYRDALEFNRYVRVFVQKKFPVEEKYVLTAQVYRAVDSIVLNIAEGADRGTDKDFANFLAYSRTSLNEVIACIDVAVNSGYVTHGELMVIIAKASTLSQQLTAFRQSLLINPTK